MQLAVRTCAGRTLRRNREFDFVLNPSDGRRALRVPRHCSNATEIGLAFASRVTDRNRDFAYNVSDIGSTKTFTAAGG